MPVFFFFFFACNQCPRVPENKQLWFGHEGLGPSFTTTLNLVSVQNSTPWNFTFKTNLDLKKPLVLCFSMNSTHTHTLNSVSSLCTSMHVHRTPAQVSKGPPHTTLTRKWVKDEGNVSVSGFLRGLQVGALHELQLWRHFSHLKVLRVCGFIRMGCGVSPTCWHKVCQDWAPTNSWLARLSFPVMFAKITQGVH